MREVKALARLCVYSGTCEPLLLADLLSIKICASPFRVYTGNFVLISRTFQGLLKDSTMVFKNKLMKNTDIHFDIFLPRCSLA